MTDEIEESESMILGSWANNGFLNFMRVYRPPSIMTWMHFAEECARYWKKMSQKEKNSYRDMPDMLANAMCIDNKSFRGLIEMCNHPMGKQQRSRKSCSKPKKSCAKPKKSCAQQKKRAACSKPKRSSCAKPRCSKPGPITNNGYLNFVRSFRKKHCGLKPQELIREAARAWIKLPEEKKDRYRRMACKVGNNERHQRRRICTGR